MNRPRLKGSRVHRLIRRRDQVLRLDEAAGRDPRPDLAEFDRRILAVGSRRWRRTAR